MRYAVLCVAIAILFCSFSATAFAYNVCADVTQDESVNLGDFVYMLDAYRHGPSLPDGRGDIDYRQNHNLGDLRYLSNYIFSGCPEGSCPPFDPYDILPTNDSLIIPTGEIPAGSGTISFPITIINRGSVFDLMLPIVVNDLDSTIAQINFVPFDLQPITIVEPFGALELLIISSGLILQDCIEPGINTLGMLEITYDASPGMTFTVDTTSFGGPRFLHHVYGDLSYEEIGVPIVITTDVSPYGNMSVEPESLFFSTLTSIPITEPDTFTVETDGNPFSWTLTHPDWLEVIPTEGISGQKVTVLPLTSGLQVGFHYGTITVTSYDAVGSPQDVIVELELKQTYPSFDANCDGSFDIDDIVLLVMYMFAGGDPPCDPCVGR